jgi:hypothetical protein
VTSQHLFLTSSDATQRSVPACGGIVFEYIMPP